MGRRVGVLGSEGSEGKVVKQSLSLSSLSEQRGASSVGLILTLHRLSALQSNLCNETLSLSPKQRALDGRSSGDHPLFSRNGTSLASLEGEVVELAEMHLGWGNTINIYPLCYR